ncbi:RDD family protein [Couchioplanes azureus]|uniref:RDD family protein n=1 Tax=Couchioplanes caeruleus TaxID=56438 RepID=UPI001670AF78|nr:RDD family protein [Couchioplanes caeruleus]GGQ79428.1 transporter [Couchioplanes caeruleus subsp. azureus]
MTTAADGGHREQLVNGEAVEVDVRHARIGSRGLALLLDMIVQVLLAVVLLVAAQAAFLLGETEEALAAAIVTVIVIAVFVAYPTVTETLSNGRSLGKRAMGLRVVREDGGPIRVRHALVRSLVGLAVEWPGLLFPPFTWAVALTTMLFSPQGRRLGDLAAGTFVIHERSPAPWGWVPAMPPPLAAWAAGLDLTNLDDDLALATRHYLARAAEIRPPMNARFAHMLAAEVSERIAQPVPPGVPPWAFLSAVLAERRRRAGGRAQATRALTQRIWPGFGRLEWSRATGPTWDPAGTNPPLLGVMKEEGRHP